MVFDNLVYNDEFTRCLGPVNKEIETAELHPNTFSIEKNAFAHCKIKNLKICKNLIYVKSNAFADSDIESIDFSGTINGIVFDDNAFYLCDKLKKVTLEKICGSVLPEELFYNCTELKTVNLQNSNITEIGEKCFQKCRKLENIYLPKILEMIKSNAFDSTNLYNISLPNSLIGFGDECFKLTPLKSLVIPDKLTLFPDNFLDNTNITNIYYNNLDIIPLKRLEIICYKYGIEIKKMDLEALLYTKTFKEANKTIKHKNTSIETNIEK